MLGRLDDAVLGERALGDRRLVEGPLDAREQARIDTVAADGADQSQRRVVEVEAGAAHRREAAERLAEPVVELTRPGRRVDLGEQSDHDVDGVGAKRWGMSGYASM